jgi:hypothetical protein
MTLTRDRIETLVITIQAAFLEEPTVDLTLRDVRKRFAVDDVTCRAVLGALVDAHVLEHTARGRYARFFPAGTASRAARVAA